MLTVYVVGDENNERVALPTIWEEERVALPTIWEGERVALPTIYGKMSV